MRLRARQQLLLMGFLLVLVAGCFGRSTSDGVASASGEEGEPCTRDTHCIPGLVCIDSMCAVFNRSPVRDAGLSTGDTAVDSAGGACVSPVVPLAADDAVLGSTASRTNQYEGSCGGGTSPEAIFELVIAERSRVRISTFDSDFDTILYVREGCRADGRELACNDDDPDISGTHSAIELVLAAGTYTVYVDGFGGTGGNYVLTTQSVPADGADGNTGSN